MNEVLGRTNTVFPRLWLALRVPHQFSEGWLERLVDAALAHEAPIDISTSPGLWGGALRGKEASMLARVGSTIDTAQDADHAANLLQAEILQTLCAVGREQIDFLMLRVKSRREEFQIEGALQALEMARQEGHVRFVGLSAEGSGMGALSTWQFHDAFDVLLVPRNPLASDAYDTLRPVAQDRRVGVVTSRPLNWSSGPSIPEGFPARDWLAFLTEDHPVLLGVRSAEEIEAVHDLKIAPEDLAKLSTSPIWDGLSTDPRPWIREAAQRRLNAVAL